MLFFLANTVANLANCHYRFPEATQGHASETLMTSASLPIEVRLNVSWIPLVPTGQGLSSGSLKFEARATLDEEENSYRLIGEDLVHQLTEQGLRLSGVGRQDGGEESSENDGADSGTVDGKDWRSLGLDGMDMYVWHNGLSIHGKHAPAALYPGEIGNSGGWIRVGSKESVLFAVKKEALTGKHGRTVKQVLQNHEYNTRAESRKLVTSSVHPCYGLATVVGENPFDDTNGSSSLSSIALGVLNVMFIAVSSKGVSALQPACWVSEVHGRTMTNKQVPSKGMVRTVRKWNTHDINRLRVKLQGDHPLYELLLVVRAQWPADKSYVESRRVFFESRVNHVPVPRPEFEGFDVSAPVARTRNSNEVWYVRALEEEEEERKDYPVHLDELEYFWHYVDAFAGRRLADELETALFPMSGPKWQRASLKGALLHGPPGTGKSTLKLGLMSAFNWDRSHVLFHGAAADLNSRYVGEMEARVRQFQAEAASRPNELFVVILEEADTLLSSSSGKTDSGSSHKGDATAVLLQVMSDVNNIFWLLTTNFKAKLDKRVVRPGRVSLSILVPPLARHVREGWLERSVFSRILKSTWWGRWANRSSDQELFKNFVVDVTIGFTAAQMAEAVKMWAVTLNLIEHRSLRLGLSSLPVLPRRLLEIVEHVSLTSEVTRPVTRSLLRSVGYQSGYVGGGASGSPHPVSLDELLTGKLKLRGVSVGGSVHQMLLTNKMAAVARLVPDVTRGGTTGVFRLMQRRGTLLVDIDDLVETVRGGLDERVLEIDLDLPSWGRGNVSIGGVVWTLMMRFGLEAVHCIGSEFVMSFASRGISGYQEALDGILEMCKEHPGRALVVIDVDPVSGLVPNSFTVSARQDESKQTGGGTVVSSSDTTTDSNAATVNKGVGGSEVFSSRQEGMGEIRCEDKAVQVPPVPGEGDVTVPVSKGVDPIPESKTRSRNWGLSAAHTSGITHSETTQRNRSTSSTTTTGSGGSKTISVTQGDALAAVLGFAEGVNKLVNPEDPFVLIVHNRSEALFSDSEVIPEVLTQPSSR